MDEKLHQHFSSLFKKTIAKRQLSSCNKGEIYEEYNCLEQVPPAPGKPGQQHDTMVQKGINVKNTETNLRIIWMQLLYQEPPKTSCLFWMHFN